MFWVKELGKVITAVTAVITLMAQCFVNRTTQWQWNDVTRNAFCIILHPVAVLFYHRKMEESDLKEKAGDIYQDKL